MNLYADPHRPAKLASIRSEAELDGFRQQLIADQGLTTDDMAAIEERRRAIRRVGGGA